MIICAALVCLDRIILKPKEDCCCCLNSIWLFNFKWKQKSFQTIFLFIFWYNYKQEWKSFRKNQKKRTGNQKSVHIHRKSNSIPGSFGQYSRLKRNRESGIKKPKAYPLLSWFILAPWIKGQIGFFGAFVRLCISFFPHTLVWLGACTMVHVAFGKKGPVRTK